MDENVPRKENYNQVCILPGVILGDVPPEEFEDHFLKEFDTRVQFLEEIVTLPNKGEPGTGGRHDILFAVHDDDVGKFSYPRLMAGIRWIEDVLAEGNYQFKIYPERFYNYKIW